MKTHTFKTIKKVTPEDMVRILNAHDEMVELLRSFYDEHQEWDADYMQSFADHARAMVEKAEGR